MNEIEYSIFLDHPLSFYLDRYCSSDESEDEPDPVNLFKEWGECLGEISKRFLSLAKAVEKENNNGAEIGINIYADTDGMSIQFYGDPDALQRLAEQGLIEDITDEDET